MNSPSKKKLFEVVWLFLKLFLSGDFEKINEYTFEKILLKSFAYFKHFP